LYRQRLPRLLHQHFRGLCRARGGALWALLRCMTILLDWPLPDACGSIPPTSIALEARLWAWRGGIDKTDNEWHHGRKFSNGSSASSTSKSAAAPPSRTALQSPTSSTMMAPYHATP